MGATRFPGKMMKLIGGMPLVELVIKRCQRSALVDKWILATTWEKEDDDLVDFIAGRLLVFRGPAENVLKRFVMCAEEYGSESNDIIVRVTADDPLKDPVLIDRVVQELLMDSGLDYCSNTIKPTFPLGLDIEAFRFRALKDADEYAIFKHFREHVTPYIWKQPDIFKMKNIENDEDLSRIRLTIDWPKDLEAINAMIGNRDPVMLDWREAMK